MYIYTVYQHTKSQYEPVWGEGSCGRGGGWGGAGGGSRKGVEDDQYILDGQITPGSTIRMDQRKRVRTLHIWVHTHMLIGGMERQRGMNEGKGREGGETLQAGTCTGRGKTIYMQRERTNKCAHVYTRQYMLTKHIYQHARTHTQR